MTQEKIKELPDEFGERLRWFRNERGLSQAELGKSVSRTATSISEWEKGASEPSLDQIAKMAEVLRVSPARLAYGPMAEEEQAHYVNSRDKIHGGGRTKPPLVTEMLNPRFQPAATDSPTLESCASYFAEFLERAKNAPGAAGWTWRQLQKHFPLDEFDDGEEHE
jgi:transcriptional regulator with XRE-family HTH domain